jgi:hypothetical protein
MYRTSLKTWIRLLRGPRAFGVALGLFAAAAGGACGTDIAPPIEISGEGNIEGLVFFDADEDGIFDPSDGDYAVANVGIVIRNRGTQDNVANGSTTSGTDGRFVVAGMPLGTHDMFIDTLTVPAGISICQNPLRVSVYNDETAFQSVNGRPGCLITIQQAKDLGEGQFVIVRGIVTSAPGQIESNFAYIEEVSGGIFLFAPSLVSEGIEVGDQIEVGGTTAFFGGQFQLGSDTQLRDLVPDVDTPTPLLVTTTEIAASGSDALDDLQNRFVRIEKALLVEAFTASGNSQNSTVDDGSGATTIRIDDGVWDRNDLDNRYPAGKCYDINGFAANFNGLGQIFPRSDADIVEVPCN